MRSTAAHAATSACSVCLGSGCASWRTEVSCPGSASPVGNRTVFRKFNADRQKASAPAPRHGWAAAAAPIGPGDHLQRADEDECSRRRTTGAGPASDRSQRWRTPVVEHALEASRQQAADSGVGERAVDKHRKEKKQDEGSLIAEVTEEPARFSGRTPTRPGVCDQQTEPSVQSPSGLTGSALPPTVGRQTVSATHLVSQRRSCCASCPA